MPTYTYRCSACEHQFEQFQRMTDEPLTECPVCGEPVKRVIHPVGVVFKGSGWYITDSRKPAPSENGAGAAEKKTAAKADGTAGADKNGKSEKTESAAKTDKSASPAAAAS